MALIYIWCKRMPHEEIRILFGLVVRSNYYITQRVTSPSSMLSWWPSLEEIYGLISLELSWVMHISLSKILHLPDIEKIICQLQDGSLDGITEETIQILEEETTRLDHLQEEESGWTDNHDSLNFVLNFCWNIL